MNTVPQKMLLATYHFPPAAAVGGLRAAKLARLLPGHGWQPYVLTVRDDLREEGLDPDRMKGLEEIPVVRTGELPRLLETVGRIRAALRQRRAPAQHSRESAPAAPVAGRLTETLERRLTRYVMSLIWCLPDAQKNWAVAAAPTAIRLIRRHHIDWIFTSGPPFSTHVIGLLAKLFTGARWIADFRDPWIEILPERRPDLRSAASDRIEQWMETAVARSADRIVTTTEPLRAAMAARYGELPRDKFICIPNGIDTSIAAGRPEDRFDTLTITYAGSLYYDRTPEPLFHAVSDLISTGRATCRDLRIKLLGDCRDADGTDIQSLITRYGLQQVVELQDRVPHAEAISIMRRSHLLLVLAPERHRLVIPAKIFDYLGTGTAILALAPRGATADLVAQTGCGRCFADTDVEGLAGYLGSLLDDGSFRRLGNDPRSFAEYDARHLAGRLVAELSRVAAGPLRSVAAGV